MTLTKSLVSAGVGVAMLALAAAPAFGASISVVGTGAFSTTNVTVNQSSSTVVAQSSNTTANTSINQTANTGNNTASFNVGSGSGITTGNVTQNASVKNKGGSNTAVVAPCGCPPSGGSILIAGTGAFSLTRVSVNQTSSQVTAQSTNSNFSTGVSQSGNSGGNDSSFNVGLGGPDIGTGSVHQGAHVTNRGGSNTAL